MQGCKAGSKFPTFTNNTLRAYPLITKMLQSGLEMCRIVALTGVSSTTIQKIKAYNDGEGGSYIKTDYVPKRTCHKMPGKMHYGERRPKCSECGYSLGDSRWNFCPKCGAEVVDGD